MSRRVFVFAVSAVWAVIAVLACPMLVREGGQAMGDEKAGREIRAAAISFVPTKFDLKGNSDKLEQMYRQAAAGGARIAVAPEGILEGYVVNQIIAGEAAAEEMKRVAVTIDSPTIKRFRKLVEHAGIKKEMRRREYYEKPSATARRARRRAARRARIPQK